MMNDFQDAEGGIYRDIWEVFDPAIGYAKNYDGGVDKVSLYIPKSISWYFKTYVLEKHNTNNVFKCITLVYLYDGCDWCDDPGR